MYVERNIEARSRILVAEEKHYVLRISCACVRACLRVGVEACGIVHARVYVALLIQHETLMRHIVMALDALLAPPHLSSFS
jgi:hypothetical protein